jgi:hypothetical protein
MSREFEISMIGELQLFLGLQIKQSKEGKFVHQAKYTKDIVRKFKMEDSKVMATPMSTTTALVGDSPRGPLKQRGNPHLKPTTKPKYSVPNHAGYGPCRKDPNGPPRRPF